MLFPLSPSPLLVVRISNGKRLRERRCVLNVRRSAVFLVSFASLLVCPPFPFLSSLVLLSLSLSVSRSYLLPIYMTFSLFFPFHFSLFPKPLNVSIPLLTYLSTYLPTHFSCLCLPVIYLHNPLPTFLPFSLPSNTPSLLPSTLFPFTFPLHRPTLLLSHPLCLPASLPS